MKLSIILFVRRWDICDKTIASILTDKNKEYISDIIIIERSNESKKEDYLNNIKEKYGSCIKYIDEHTSSTNIMDTAVQMADGEYINVCEVGIEWNNSVVTEINKVTSKGDYDFLIMPCSHELMMSAYDTVFMSFFEEPKTINVYDKFKMFHIFYPSYFISKKLFIQNNFKTESDLLSILEKMFYISCNSKFAYLLVNGKFSWDECSALKDIELEFQTHQERMTDFIINLEKYISNNTFTKNAQFQVATYLKYLFKFSTYYKGKISDERLDALKEALDSIINQLDVSMISLHGSFTSIQKNLLFSKVN